MQFTSWVDAVIFVFSLENETSFNAIYNYYAKMSQYRNMHEIPLILVGTQGMSHLILKSFFFRVSFRNHLDILNSPNFIKNLVKQCIVYIFKVSFLHSFWYYLIPKLVKLHFSRNVFFHWFDEIMKNMFERQDFFLIDMKLSPSNMTRSMKGYEMGHN